MDKKEFLKRWTLGCIEPSFFYIPWKENQASVPSYGSRVQFSFHVFKNVPGGEDGGIADIFYGTDINYQHDEKDSCWKCPPIICVYNITGGKKEFIYSNATINNNGKFVVENKTVYEIYFQPGKYRIEWCYSGAGLYPYNNQTKIEFEIVKSNTVKTIQKYIMCVYQYMFFYIDRKFEQKNVNIRTISTKGDSYGRSSPGNTSSNTYPPNDVIFANETKLFIEYRTGYLNSATWGKEPYIETDNGFSYAPSENCGIVKYCNQPNEEKKIAEYCADSNIVCEYINYPECFMCINTTRIAATLNVPCKIARVGISGYDYYDAIIALYGGIIDSVFDLSKEVAPGVFEIYNSSINPYWEKGEWSPYRIRSNYYSVPNEWFNTDNYYNIDSLRHCGGKVTDFPVTNYPILDQWNEMLKETNEVILNVKNNNPINNDDYPYITARIYKTTESTSSWELYWALSSSDSNAALESETTTRKYNYEFNPENQFYYNGGQLTEHILIGQSGLVIYQEEVVPQYKLIVPITWEGYDNHTIYQCWIMESIKKLMRGNGILLNSIDDIPVSQ